MTNCTRYLGLDVHAETITAAIAEGRGRIRSIGKFPNRPEAVRKLIEKLDGGRHLKNLLRGRPDGLRLVLAAHQARRRLRSHRAVAHSQEGR